MVAEVTFLGRRPASSRRLSLDKLHYYFSCCCDQISDRKELKEEGFNLVYSSRDTVTVQCRENTAMVARACGRPLPHTLADQEVKHDHKNQGSLPVTNSHLLKVSQSEKIIPVAGEQGSHFSPWGTLHMQTRCFSTLFLLCSWWHIDGL